MKTLASAIVAEEVVNGAQYRIEIVVKSDGHASPAGEDWEAQTARIEAAAEAQAQCIKGYADFGALHAQSAEALSLRIKEQDFPGGPIVRQHMELAEHLEKEVESAFGDGAALYGRAVALYAVRDMLGVNSAN